MPRCFPARCLALALFLAAVVATPAAAFKRTFQGDVLQDFELPGVAGEPLRLSEHWGEKATVVIFWASWSPRSAEALGEFQQLYADHRADGLQVVAVNVEHQKLAAPQQEALATFVATQGLTYPVLVDEGLVVFDRFGVIAVPSLLVADAGGTVRELLEGYSNMTRCDFRDRVLEILGVQSGKPAPSAAEVSAYCPVGKAARYYQMGNLFLHKKMTGRAAKALRRAIQEDPKYAAAYVRLAEVQELQGKDAAAAATREQAAALGVAPPPVTAAGGPAVISAGEGTGATPPALKAAATSAELAPGNAEVAGGGEPVAPNPVASPTAAVGGAAVDSPRAERVEKTPAAALAPRLVPAVRTARPASLRGAQPKPGGTPMNRGSIDAIPATAVEMAGAQGVRMRIAVGEPQGAPNFVMRVFDVAPGGYTPRHRHDFEHEVFVLSGAGTLVEEAGDSPLAPGTVVFVPPGALHQFRAADDTGLRFICVVPRS